MNIKKILIICFITILIILASVNIPIGLSSRAKKNIIDHEKKTVFSIISPLEKTRSKILSSQFLRNSLFSNKDVINLQNGLLGGTIHTRCDDLEKTTEVFFGIFNDIDVDNDENTGVNGADIRVQYLLLPWIEFDPDFRIGILFTINVERIGKEIKNRDFNVTMEVGGTDVRIGFWSPAETGNEIPDSTRLSFMIFFNPFERTNGFGFYIYPKYNTKLDDKKIVLFAEYNNGDLKKGFSFEFDPAIESQITITSTRFQGRWNYQFTRETSQDSSVKTNFIREQDNEKKEIIFAINKLPKEISFSLELSPLAEGGGKFLYDGNEIYDMELIIISNELGVCKYATIKNTPKEIIAEWIPTKTNGSYLINVDSEGGETDFILKDSLIDPMINFTVNNLGNINLKATWNLTNPGNFVVKKEPLLNIDLEFYIGEWVARLDAKPIAEDISIEWDVNLSGYLIYDTNWQSLNEIDLLIKGENLGLRTIAETFKTENFRLNWTIWPPVEWNLEQTGEIDFFTISIYLYLQGDWYLIWPF